MRLIHGRQRRPTAYLPLWLSMLNKLCKSEIRHKLFLFAHCSSNVSDDYSYVFVLIIFGIDVWKIILGRRGTANKNVCIFNRYVIVSHECVLPSPVLYIFKFMCTIHGSSVFFYISLVFKIDWCNRLLQRLRHLPKVFNYYYCIQSVFSNTMYSLSVTTINVVRFDLCSWAPISGGGQEKDISP